MHPSIEQTTRTHSTHSCRLPVGYIGDCREVMLRSTGAAYLAYPAGPPRSQGAQSAGAMTGSGTEQLRTCSPSQPAACERTLGGGGVAHAHAQKSICSKIKNPSVVSRRRVGWCSSRNSVPHVCVSSLTYACTPRTGFGSSPQLDPSPSARSDLVVSRQQLPG